MCLIAIAWKARSDLTLVVAANRDEWRERPTEAAHWWPDHPDLFAGRDLRAGGTWMGAARNGRFAAVTNFRDPSDQRSTARSRGGLVTDFLLSEQSPAAFLDALAQRAGHYNGFSLVAGDGSAMWYFGSREGAARAIEPGVHGLSNHLLDEPWPKVVRSRTAMQDSLADRDPAPRLFAMLADGGGAPDEALPDTGVGITWERRLAAPLITGADYGTRASTVLTRSALGEVVFEERSIGDDGRVVGTRRERFAVAG
ncbi:MAG TPA: NRDE family protein [Myxococcota bacterium]|nr:NRDE family protein [Myxococcota bacterium]